MMAKSTHRTPLILSLCLSICTGSLLRAQGDREADHEALIALRDQFTEALNNRNFEAMKPLVSDSLTFISISNEKVEGIDGLEEYWNRLFNGEQSILKSISVSPKPDGPTIFEGDSVGISMGTSEDAFEFRGVGRRELTSRWTAIVRKENDSWKVSSVHMSANVLDNPVLDAAQKAGGLVRLIIGLVVGVVIGALLFRRKSPRES